MGFSKEVANYEGSPGQAMMNYGSSNESGQLLARELFARELQARELLAREMGSQVDSQAGDSRRKKMRQRSSSSRSLPRPSSNISLDGSMMSRSRWEPEPKEQCRHESSSLPAEFLYFKFEQMAARWVKQRKTASVVSSREQQQHRPRKTNRPPKTITTMTIPTKTSNTAPDHEEDKKVPRFMRNTTNSASKFDVSRQPLARHGTPQRDARAAGPNKNQKTAGGRNNSTGRKRASPSPVRINSVDRQKATTQAATGKGKPTYRSNSPMRKQTQSATKAGHLSSQVQKKGNPKRNIRVETRTYPRESRSPLDTTEDVDAPHYRRRETVKQKQQRHDDDDEDSYLLYHPHDNINKADAPELNRPPSYTPLSHKPDPEGPSASSRPDPDGNRWASPLRGPAPPTTVEEQQSDLPPTPKVQPPTPIAQFYASLEEEEDRNDSNTGTLRSKQTDVATPEVRSPSPTRKKTPSSSPSPNQKGRRTTTPSPNRNSSSSAKKSPATRSTTPLKGPAPKDRKSPDPQKKTPVKKSTPPQSKESSNPTNSGTKRRQSRLPPLPSFRNPSPNPQQKVSLNNDRENQPSSPNRKTSGRESETSARIPGPTSPRRDASAKSATSPTNKGTKSPRKDTSKPSPKSPRTPSSSPRSAGNKVSPSSPRNQKSGRKVTTPIAAADRLHKGIPPTTKGTRSPQLSPRSTTAGKKPTKRYRLMHARCASVIQRNVRMMLNRQKFLLVRRTVITLQSAVRRRQQVRTFQQARKWSRIHHFSCTVIQKYFRMISCRQSYLQLRNAVIMAQSTVRMFSCKTTYTELRSASKKLFGRSSVTTNMPPTPKSQAVTVRGGRLRIYSALLIQSIVRMIWVRGAYLELRASAQVIQKWFRKMHVVIVKRRKAATVLQCRARMLSWRACFLDLRRSIILLQKWSRMACSRTKYLREKRLRLENTSVSRIQSLVRRDSCQFAYHQLRASTIVVQHWIRGMGIRLAFFRLREAAVSIQCWARQRISEHIARELRCIVKIQTFLRLHRVSRAFMVQRACALMIQATIRGFLYRERYLSLKLAAIVVQTRRRVVLARTYVAVKRSALWVGATKMKRARTNISPLPPLRDTVQVFFQTDSKARPDPIVVDLDKDPSNKSAELMDLDAAKSSKQYDDVVSAALAFVSQSPLTAPTNTKDPTPRRSKPSPSPSKPAGLGQEKATKPSLSPSKPSGWGQAKDAGTLMLPLEEPFDVSRKPRDPSPHFINISKNRFAMDPYSQRKRTQEPVGNNMSRLPLPTSTHDPECPMTPKPADMDSKPFEMLHYTPTSSLPHLPNQNNLPFGFRESVVSMSSNQPQGASPVLPTVIPRSIPSNLISGSADMFARMSPVELSPSPQQQPYYFISPTPEGSIGSPQLYTLQPLNELTPPRADNPLLYYVSNTQESRRHFPQEGPKTGLNASYFEGIKRDRAKQLITSLKQESQSPSEIEFPPIPSIASNPSYYLPKEGLKKKRSTKENEPVSAETESDDSGVSPLDDRDDSPLVNPLKKVIVQNRNNHEISIPKFRKEEGYSEKAISEKLATLKQRSRARKIQRWTKRTLKREKTTSDVNADASKGNKIKKGTFVDIAVNQWTKQTLHRQKMSILTTELDSEFATQIQSAWRSHRDQILLAGLILQTWSVSCDFTPDTMGGDRILRQNANILALDGAYAQVGYHLQNCKTLVKKGLAMLQWEGFIPIQFSEHNLPAEDTCCVVGVHCTANQSRFLNSWSETKRSTLLVKAAISKYGEDQRLKLRRSSIFKRSLTRKRANSQPKADHDSTITTGDDTLTPARQLAELRRRYEDKGDFDINGAQSYNEILSRHKAVGNEKVTSTTATLRGVPNDFHQRLRELSAIQIQSWYRMCACRSMFQGLRRIQSRVLLRIDKEDVETINFYRFSEKHPCETIVEEEGEGGFECTTGSSDS